jgi:putative ABC transport system permease protein
LSSTSTGRPGLERARAAKRGLPFWLGTPLRLRRFPGVLFAVIGAAVVLAVATASGPLFLSSAGAAALGEHLTQARRNPALTVTGFGPVSQAFIGPADGALRATGRRVPQLEPPVLSVVADLSAIHAGSKAGEASVHLISRTGFLSHVRAQGSPAQAGVWLSDTDATALGVRAGDVLRFRSGSSTATAPVAGTFEPFGPGPLDPYWAPVASFLRGTQGSPASPVLLADLDTMTTIGTALAGTGRVQWDFALAPGRMSLAQGQSLAAALVGIEGDAGNPRTELGAAFQPEKFHTSAPGAESPIPSLVGEASQVADAIKGPVETISSAGRVLALLGVAAAGIYGVRRRRVETSLLTSRGIPPLLQGSLAVVEALLPAIAGAVAGWLMAVLLIRALGPSGFVEAQAQRAALASAGVSVAVGLVLLGVAAAVAARLEFEEVTGRLPGLASRAPWEAVVLVLAAAAFYELANRGSAVVAGDAPRLDRLLLLFPLLFMAGFSGLAVRGLRRVLARFHGSGRRLATSSYLALRRLASAPRIALLLVTASSLAVGILVNAAMVSASVNETSRQKALVVTGSDVAISVPAGIDVPTVASPVTVVGRLTDASVVPGTQAVDVLVVDPSTFAAAAFWDPSFSASPLAELMTKLSRPGIRIPAVAAGLDVSGEASLRVSGTIVALSIVEDATAFPGMRPGRAMVIVSRSGLGSAAAAAATQADGDRTLWAKGSPPAVLTSFRRAGFPVAGAETARALQRTPSFLAVSWTFSFLEALGIVAGSVALIGLVLYLQSRQQAREIAYALSRRMGLSKGTHRRSVALELAGMLFGAFVIGTVLAAAATRLIYRKLDLLPSLPPTPLYRIPIAVLGEIAGVVAVTAVAGAFAVQRRAQRANVAEVMRLAA